MLKKAIKCLSLLLVLILSVSFMPISEIVSSAVQPELFYGGTGTAEDPYLISTKKHLDNMRLHPAASFKLINGITFSDSDFEENGDFYNYGKGWVPVGTEDNKFTGDLDGDGFIISNLYINDPDLAYTGLFGYTSSSVITNLKLKNFDITGGNYTGGLVGYLYCGKIKNCTFSGKVKGNNCVGGIAGYKVYSGTIESCSIRGSVEGQTYVGGVVGVQNARTISGSNGCVIQNCNNAAAINGIGHVGGIAGQIMAERSCYHRPYENDNTLCTTIGAGNSYIKNCSNSGSISSSGSCVGGILGSSSGKNTSTASEYVNCTTVINYMYNCYNTGDITSNGYSTGGLTGSCNYYHFYAYYSYSVGTVTSKGTGGGCFGTSIQHDIYCYYLDTSIAEPNNNGGSAVSSEQLMLKSTFGGWDFNTIWSMDGREEYPYPELIGVPLVLPEDIEEHEHSYSRELTTPPTHLEKGTEIFTCECGDTYFGDVATLPDHTYSMTVTDPTCSQDGFKLFTCECGDSYTESIPAINHSDTADILVDSSEYPESEHNYGTNLKETKTFTYEGANKLTITFSPDTMVEESADKIYLYDKNGRTVGNYTGSALAGKTITISGDTFKIKLVSDGSVQKYGYSFTSIVAEMQVSGFADWEQVTAPTCLESGLEKSICTYCGDEETREIPALGHDMVTDVAKEPDCINTGLTEGSHCTRCDHKIEQEIIPAINHERGKITVDKSKYPESAHKYPNNLNETQSFSWPGAQRLLITFSAETNVESGYDYIYIYDKDGNLVAKHTNIQLSKKTLVINGDAFSIKLTSDGSNQAYGYSFTSIVADMGGYGEWELLSEANCTENGSKKRVCSLCGYEDFVEIPALGHNIITVTPKEASCTESGLTEGYYCSRCNHGVKSEEIPALGHDMISYPEIAADCVNSGMTAGSQCSRCDYKIGLEVIPAPGHDIVADAAKEPSCTDSGLTAGEHCTRCDYKIEQEVISPLNHDAGDILVDSSEYPESQHNYTNNLSQTKSFSWQGAKNLIITFSEKTMVESGYDKIYLYGTGNTLIGTYTGTALAGKTITVPGDTFKIKLTSDNSVQNYGYSFSSIVADMGGYSDWETKTAVSCTENGVSYRVCSICGNEETKTTPALGHDMIHEEGTAPDCTNTGLTESSYCSRCDYKVENAVIPALGHDMINDDGTEPDCTNTGLTKGAHCSRCDYKVENTVIPALGHDMITDNRVEPDCTNTGLTEGAHCSRCNYCVEQEIIPATGHSHTSEITAPATHLKEGVMTFTCGCGDTYTEVIEKTAEHKYTSVVTAPTCTEQGFTTFTCECGATYADGYVDATGHSHTSEITAPATHLKEGVMTFTCECGDTYTEVIEKTAEHKYTSVVTAPTCTEQGFTTFTCECGATYADGYVDATGHSDTDNDGYCNNCDELLCDHACHKSGISGFFWKITCFFSKLFGSNKFCECGAAHY